MYVHKVRQRAGSPHWKGILHLVPSSVRVVQTWRIATFNQQSLPQLHIRKPCSFFNFIGRTFAVFGINILQGDKVTTKFQK